MLSAGLTLIQWSAAPAGARGDGTSLYFEDPNGHSVEIMTYEE